MDKRERELRKLLRRLDCRLAGYTGSTHRKIVCNKTGREISTSLSPKNMDMWLKQVERHVIRMRKGVYDAS
jgi:hypothetical protein